jgi:hypothetical protein
MAVSDLAFASRVRKPNESRYPAFAALLGLLAAFDWGFASAFFFSAHRWRILSAAASR